MKFDHRIYSGSSFRPKPEIHFDENGGLLIIATPWGSRSSAKKAIETITDFVHSSVDDPDFTSPFSIMSCISSLANHLRIAVMLTNDTIYQEDNRDEYTTGVELLVLMKKGPQIAWAHVGHPAILLDRPGHDLQPLSTHYDLSMNFSGKDSELPPLAGEFIGVYPTSNINVQTMHCMPGDSLVFLSRTAIPASFYASQDNQTDINKLVSSLTEDNSYSPFWVGKLQVS